MATVAELQLLIKANAKQAHSEVDGLKSKLSGFMSSVGTLGAGAGLAVAGIGAAVGKLGFDFNSMQQQSEIAFTTI